MSLALAAPSFTLAKTLKALTDQVSLRTDADVQLIDITALVDERVRRSGIATGLVMVQSRHTTAGLIVNEDEPLLMDDLKRTLERLAPRELRYAHDDLARRDPLTLSAEERLNGHAHCQALALAPSITLQIQNGALSLGRYQRLFFVELDGGRQRAFSIVALGLSSDTPRWS
ncbi:MAG: secondary thiamine-phosphate synthase enzyme YjbQ [Vicinamibacteria bacterium]|jgi:secondary thiamine-phosphate synthase enzyme|nr:secondary thiamine-phosphate synthase enzyme YjbQ [Vicinamibacteria bacterium]